MEDNITQLIELGEEIQPQGGQRAVKFDVKLKHGEEMRRFQLEQCTYRAITEAVQRLYPGFRGRLFYQGLYFYRQNMIKQFQIQMFFFA